MTHPPLAHGAVPAFGPRANPPLQTIAAIVARRRKSSSVRVQLALELLDTAASLHAAVRRILGGLHLSQEEFAILLIVLTADPDPTSARNLAVQTGATSDDVITAVDQLASLRLVTCDKLAGQDGDSRVSITRWGRELTIAALDVLANHIHRSTQAIPVGAVKSATTVCKQFGEDRSATHHGTARIDPVQKRSRASRLTLQNVRGTPPHNPSVS